MDRKDGRRKAYGGQMVVDGLRDQTTVYQQPMSFYLSSKMEDSNVKYLKKFNYVQQSNM